MAENSENEKGQLVPQNLDEANREMLPEEVLRKALGSWAHGAGIPEMSVYRAFLLVAWCQRRSDRGADFVGFLQKASELLALPKGKEQTIAELDRRTRTQGELIARIKADVEDLKRGAPQVQTQEVMGGVEKWPSYISEDFEVIVERTRDLESAGGDTGRIQYCMLELETLLRRIEEKARSTGRKYEGRLAASLRSVTVLYEPDEISEEQAKRFALCVRALTEEWGQLNREGVSWIRSKLLEVGLTWLPVTRKAQREIEEAEREAATANG